MKILHCIHSANPETGGTIASVVGLAPALEKLGHTNTLISLDPPSSAFLKDLPFQAVGLGPGVTGFGYSPGWNAWLRSHLKAFDKLIIHGLWQYPMWATPPLARQKGIPYCVYPHGMLDPWFNQKYPIKKFKKTIYWRLFEHRNLARAAAVLFTCREEMLQARTSFRPYRLTEKIAPLGIANPPEGITKGPSESRPYLLFLGRIHEKKGVDLLLNAYREWPDRETVDLVLAGPNQAQHLTHPFQESIGDSLRFVGMVEGEEKWRLFREAAAFILPSHQENFGISVVEALACGIPVLLSNKVNIWREIAQAEAGFVEEDDLPGVKRLLNRWSQTTPRERTEMEENARNLFLNHFEAKRAAALLEPILVDAKA